MTRSLLRLVRRGFRRRHFENVPFAGNAHLMRDIGIVADEPARFALTYQLPPR